MLWHAAMGLGADRVGRRIRRLWLGANQLSKAVRDLWPPANCWSMRLGPVLVAGLLALGGAPPVEAQLALPALPGSVLPPGYTAYADAKLGFELALAPGWRAMGLSESGVGDQRLFVGSASPTPDSGDLSHSLWLQVFRLPGQVHGQVPAVRLREIEQWVAGQYRSWQWLQPFPPMPPTPPSRPAQPSMPSQSSQSPQSSQPSTPMQPSQPVQPSQLSQPQSEHDGPAAAQTWVVVAVGRGIDISRQPVQVQLWVANGVVPDGPFYLLVAGGPQVAFQSGHTVIQQMVESFQPTDTSELTVTTASGQASSQGAWQTPAQPSERASAQPSVESPTPPSPGRGEPQAQIMNEFRWPQQGISLQQPAGWTVQTQMIGSERIIGVVSSTGQAVVRFHLLPLAGAKAGDQVDEALVAQMGAIYLAQLGAGGVAATSGASRTSGVSRSSEASPSNGAGVGSDGAGRAALPGFRVVVSGMSKQSPGQFEALYSYEDVQAGPAAGWVAMRFIDVGPAAQGSAQTASQTPSGGSGQAAGKGSGQSAGQTPASSAGQASSQAPGQSASASAPAPAPASAPAAAPAPTATPVAARTAASVATRYLVVMDAQAVTDQFELLYPTFRAMWDSLAVTAPAAPAPTPPAAQ